MTYVPKKTASDDKYVAYRLAGHGMAGKRKDVPYLRTPDLSVIKIEAEMGSTVVHQHYTSIYLGKYWVGNLFTPLYDDITLSSRRFWNNPLFTRNKVERRLPAAGIYKAGSLTSNDSDSPVPANGQRESVGARAMFWGRADYTYYAGLWLMSQLHKTRDMNQFTGEEWVRKMETDYKGSFSGMSLEAFPDGGRNNKGWSMSNLNQNRVRLFLPLIVYSDTYQGDSAD